MIAPTSEVSAEEEVLYQSLRATVWDEFLGQDPIKNALTMSISAAKQRSESLDHTLFYGPPGLGKTTLSHLIAQEMGTQIRLTSGTALAKAADLAAILTNLQPGDVLFIDEIHRLPKAVEETLYPVMEDFALDIVIGKGPSARTVRLDIPHFTLVGATTRFGALAAPFRDRFGVIHRLEYYTPQELAQILLKAAEKLHVQLDPLALDELGRRARGTPRIALKLLKRVRDFVQVQSRTMVNKDDVINALSVFAIDEKGLDHSDRRMLDHIIRLHRGGPVGLSTIAASLNEDPLTIEEVIEPYLLQLGFLQRTPRGRVVTENGYRHLGMPYTSTQG